MSEKIGRLKLQLKYFAGADNDFSEGIEVENESDVETKQRGNRVELYEYLKKFL